MILYTMMPEELIFPLNDQEFNKQMVINYNGIPIVVEREDVHEYRIIRVLSSDPIHYLAGFDPGTKITLS